MMWQEFPLAKSDRVLLANKIETETLPQTLLLEGGDPERRSALADKIAEALVCVGEGEKPCGVCRSCVKCKAESHPDIKRFAPPKKNAAFKVETAREIRKDAFLVPNDGKNKVYILEDSQNMNDSSENALLKILEEPPQGVFFLLTCQSASAMLPTILSRAMVLRLTDEAEEEYSDEAMEIAAGIAKSLATGTEMQTLLSTASLEKDRDEVKDVLSLLSRFFSAALLLRNGKSPETALAETANLLASRLTEAKLYALLQATEELELSAKRNANVNLLVTSLCYKLRRSMEHDSKGMKAWQK